MFNRRLLVERGDTVLPLPTTDTDLWATTAADEDGFTDTISIMIPAGVNVIYVGGGINSNESGDPCYCGMKSTSKSWFYAAGENSVGATQYIGVTPQKCIVLLLIIAQN